MADADLLTVVDVGEVDPALKNKKLTISGTKAYLNGYYLPRTGGTVNGSVDIQDNLTVQNQATTSGLNVTYVVNAGSLYVSGATEITGTLSGTTITGTNINVTNITSQTFSTNAFSTTSITGVSGTFTSRVSGQTVTGITGAFTQLFASSGDISDRLKAGTVTGDYGAFGTITGATGIYTFLSGTTTTGTNANFTTGTFQTINAGSHTITGNSVISGNLIVRGSGYFSSGVQITGTLSGTTVTGSTARFTNITGTTITANTSISGATVTGNVIQATNAVFVVASGSEFIAGGTTFVSGAGDVRPYGLFSFPATVGTAGFVLQTNGNGTTSWVVQSGGGGSEITTIMQSKIVIDVNFGITAGYNGLSQGPVEIQDTFTVDIPDGSRWAILV